METSTPSPAAGQAAGHALPDWAQRGPVLLSRMACLVLFVMMFLTFADVLGRYLFLSPLPAAYEMVSLMMPALIFMALPLSITRKAHVTVDLLDGLIPRRMHHVQSVFVNVLSALALALISWRLAVRSQDQYTYEEVSDELGFELWPFSISMAVLSAIATFLLVITVFYQLKSTSQSASDD